MSPFVDLAVSALMDEAELTPKPALVDQRTNGAHHDLDLSRLRRSAWALRDGFVAIARAAGGMAPSLRLREELGRIGRAMERRMMEAAGGSNTHRGAIWSLGLLVAAAASRLPQARSSSEGSCVPHLRFGLVATAARLARLSDRYAPCPPSHGACARSHFGASGARGEAQAGFPHAVQFGLPTLHASRARGAPEERARLDALLAIMAHLDDTCLLHRGGTAALETAQLGARAVLDVGGTATRPGMERLHRLHDNLMARWASPGGSADLLGVTLFLDRLEGQAWKL